MSGATAGAAAGAAAAAAARAARMREEEEDMTKYTKDDLEGWEFKIVRANTRRFKNYREVQRICQEEAKAGWELVEKLDDSRMRFKRRTDNRANDHLLDVDPYRTQVGISQGNILAVVLGIIAVIAGVVIVLAQVVD
ncbi:MAG: hypothetical protein AB1744_06185 [Candidatus Zixiibacteriota bacterium]